MFGFVVATANVFCGLLFVLIIMCLSLIRYTFYLNHTFSKTSVYA